MEHMRTLAQGEQAPDFELSDQRGEPQRLSALLQRGTVVLFFYPGAMTTGCTREACHFRDLREEFADVGALPVGISMDPVERQRRFDERDGLGLTLLSDPTGEVARAYGVRRRFLTPVKRATFVIGPDQVVAGVVTNEFSMNVHADTALESLRQRVH